MLCLPTLLTASSVGAGRRPKYSPAKFQGICEILKAGLASPATTGQQAHSSHLFVCGTALAKASTPTSTAILASRLIGKL